MDKKGNVVAVILDDGSIVKKDIADKEIDELIKDKLGKSKGK